MKEKKKKKEFHRAMKSNGGAVFLLFLAFLSLALCTESENGSKKRGESITRQKSNSKEETEEETAVEDMENAFERLHELSVLRDTILKLVPASDPIYEKISKQVGRKDEESKTETLESPSKETLENPPGTRNNVWMKTMIAETTKDSDLVINERQFDDEDMESWENQELFDMVEEEIQEPLSPEQRTGKSKS